MFSPCKHVNVSINTSLYLLSGTCARCKSAAVDQELYDWQISQITIHWCFNLLHVELICLERDSGLFEVLRTDSDFSIIINFPLVVQREL